MERQIKQIAAQNPYGFTFSCKTKTLVKYGIVVSYQETQNCFGDEGLKKVIEHAMNHDNIIGGWLNSENGHFYFDSCKLFTDLNEAIEFGKANKQIAIFDLTNLNEIKL